MLFPDLRLPLVVTLTLFGIGQAAASTAPPLQADIRYEIISHSPEGISKTLKYRDRFYRDDRQVWLERVIPANSAEEPHHEHDEGAAHHRLDLHDINFETAARHVVKSGDDKADITFISRANKLQVHVETENYGAVGFNNNWPSAFHLFDPAALAKMSALPRQAPAGSRWYGSNDGTAYLRILWDQTRRFPLRIESGRLDGSLKRTIVTSPQRLTEHDRRPWQEIDEYIRKDYNDLLD